jgi:hypothetical protein
MSALVWIGGAALLVLVVLIAAWRLRRAARTLEAILAEEVERDPGVPRDGTPRGTPTG